MPSLNFPANPALNQVHTVGDRSWSWNGVAWQVVRVALAGASAYEIAVQNGFVGSEAAWVASLEGSQGPKGDTGDTGPAGPKGDKGDPGINGTDGVDGTNGTNGVGVPSGGGTGQVLAKNSNADFDTLWITPDYFSDYNVPLGGNAGQYLGKVSAADGDFAWLNLPPYTSTPELPSGGSAGQVLTKNSATTGDVIWANPVTGNFVPDGGTSGYVLTKSSNLNGDYVWAAAPSGLPTGGTTGQILAKASNTNGDAIWIDAPTGGSGSGTGVTAWAPVTATGTGASQNITLPEAVSDEYEIDVYVNGLHQNQADYTVSGTTLTLTTNAAGASIEVRSALRSSSSMSLDNLNDVDLTTPPSNNQVLVYDSVSSLWKAGTVSSSSYTDEMARDAIGNALVAGSGISIAVDDTSDTITVSSNPSAIEASTSEVWTGSTSSKVVTPKSFFDSAATQALTDGATITINGNMGLNFSVTLGGNRFLDNPTNMKPGQSGVIIVTQDSSGGRTLTYGSNWKFPGGAAVGGVLSTTVGAVDVISYYVRLDGSILANIGKDYKS